MAPFHLGVTVLTITIDTNIVPHPRHRQIRRQLVKSFLFCCNIFNFSANNLNSHVSECYYDSYMEQRCQPVPSGHVCHNFAGNVKQCFPPTDPVYVTSTTPISGSLSLRTMYILNKLITIPGCTVDQYGRQHCNRN